MKEISLIIADDEEIYRFGLKRALEIEPGFKVVDEASSIPEAIRKVNQFVPDIFIIDLKWGGDEMAGWTAITEVKVMRPSVKIIAITAHEHLIRDARKAGADVGLVKTYSRKELIQIVKELADRPGHFNPKLPENAGPVPVLSNRELDVLLLVSEGFSDREIAKALHLSENTVRNHVKSILAKLEVKNRTAAAVTAKEKGLL